MTIKTIIDEDFSHYKKPSMVIAFPSCTFKCEKECGMQVCQNGTLATMSNIEVSYKEVIERYLSNNLTSAIVMAGLEPFDSWNDLHNIIIEIREKTTDDIVIYTGYNKEEISYAVDWLHLFPNIIVKFGRFIPNQTQHYDEVLGVYLASLNQRGERIS